MDRPETLQLHARRMEMTPQLETHLLKRFAFCKQHPLHLTIQQGPNATASFEVHARLDAFKSLLVASGDGSDPYAAVDSAADRLRRQWSTLHAKVVEKRRR